MGLEAIELADWRRRVVALYAAVRQADDPAAAWRAWRSGRDALLRGHAQSPLTGARREAFAGLAFFDYDPAWRLLCEVAAASGPAVPLDAGEDGTVRARPVAITVGLAPALGGELTLYWIEGYGGGLFLPFRDATAGRETYGGGRYLLDTIKGADLGREGGRLVLDFNFAYHPSCAYSPRWVCPLSPPANRVPAAVRAGERLVAAPQ